MTAKRRNFSLVFPPPDEGGLKAIGGYNGDNFIDVVESLDGEGETEWRRLAPPPLPLSSPGGGVYFKQRILVVCGYTTGYAKNFLFGGVFLLLLWKIVPPNENLFSFLGWQGLWQLGVEGSWKPVLHRRCFVWDIIINRLLLVTFF